MSKINIENMAVTTPITSYLNAGMEENSLLFSDFFYWILIVYRQVYKSCQTKNINK